MTPSGIIVNVLTGTGIKVVTILVIIGLSLWVIYSMYETSLRVKNLKQMIALNEIELAGKIV